MDRCPASEQLRQLLEDHLSEADRDPVARHVDQCGRCQERLEQLTASSSNPTWRVPPSPPPAPLPRPDFLRQLKGAAAPAEAGRPAVAAAWPTIPGYEILDELGRGGM